MTIIPERLTPITYKAGSHLADGADMCVMEAVAYIAGEPWSDHPECVCPVIAAFMRTWNDWLPTDDDRARLFGDVTDPTSLVRLVVGTRSTLAVRDRRAFMAADWTVRTFTPAWLRLAGLNGYAAGDAARDALAATVAELQESAQALVRRMCEVQP